MKILLKYVVEETQKFVSICRYKESTTEEKFGGNGSKTFDQNWADVFKMAYDKGSCLHFSRRVFDVFQALLY